MVSFLFFKVMVIYILSDNGKIDDLNYASFLRQQFSL